MRGYLADIYRNRTVILPYKLNEPLKYRNNHNQKFIAVSVSDVISSPKHRDVRKLKYLRSQSHSNLLRRNC